MLLGMKRVLVTGGAGFIGSNFLDWLARNTDASWTVLDSLTYAGNLASFEGLPSERHAFVEGSVADLDLVSELVEAHDVVVHFAAESHNDNSLDAPRAFIDTNIVGTFNVLQAVRVHERRLHHVSTDEVYGDLELNDPAKFAPDSPSTAYREVHTEADHEYT